MSFATASAKNGRPLGVTSAPLTSPGGRVVPMAESQIQKIVFDHLRVRAMPGAVYWHTPNDKSSRTKSGYRAGVSDVSVVYRGTYYAMELKKDGGRATEEQLKFVSEINNTGGYAVVAEGLDEAISILECWGILRKAA